MHHLNVSLAEHVDAHWGANAHATQGAGDHWWDNSSLMLKVLQVQWIYFIRDKTSTDPVGFSNEGFEFIENILCFSGYQSTA